MIGISTLSADDHVSYLLSRRNVCMLEARDAAKRPIIMVRGKGVGTEGPCLAQDILTALALLIEYLNEVEEFQARGVVYVIDCQDFIPGHLKLYPIDFIVKSVRNVEAMTAGRHKGFHFINMHPLIAYPLQFAFKGLSVKWRDRLKIHKNFDTFDLVDRKDLPSEYGGETSFKELGVQLLKKISERHESFIKYDEMRVNEACYPKAFMSGDTDMLKIAFNSQEFDKVKGNENFGMYGSFRKLEID